MTRSATGRGSSAPRPRPRRPPARAAHRTGKEGCAARGGIRLLGRNPAGAGRQPASVHQRRSKQALHQTAPQRARASCLSRQDARATKSGRRRDTGALGTEAAEGHALLGARLLARAEGLRPAARHGAATPAPPRATEHGRRGREQEEACRSASQGQGVGAAWQAAAVPAPVRTAFWNPRGRRVGSSPRPFQGGSGSAAPRPWRRPGISTLEDSRRGWRRAARTSRSGDHRAP